MGRHGLRKVTILFGVPVCVSVILLLTLAATVAATTDNPMATAPAGTMTRLHKLLNISQTEYETKHREYFDLVEQNQRKRLNESGIVDTHQQAIIVRRRLYRFTHSGLENSRTPRDDSGQLRLRLDYDIHIPEDNSSDVQVEEASLRLLLVPKRCSDTNSPVTLVATRTTDGVELSRATFGFQACRPQWTAMNVVQAANDKEQVLPVTLRCVGCEEHQVQVVNPVVNVIVAINPRNSRIRNRRATAKRKRKPKCSKHDLEVDFSKLDGYDFIIQPRQHNIGMCKGRCNRKDADTQHSMFMSLLSKMGHQLPKPCCTPSKMADLEILHSDEKDPSKLQISTWKKTTVLECSCT